MHKLAIKRVYEPPDPSDGMRILIDRLWPRGVSKERAHLDLWEKEIAPSPDLRKWFDHREDRFEAFKTAYLNELDGSDHASQFAERCANWLKEQNVTLLYGAKSNTINHAVITRDWLTHRMTQGAYEL